MNVDRFIRLFIVLSLLVFVMACAKSQVKQQAAKPSGVPEHVKEKEEVAVVTPQEAQPVMEKELKSEFPAKCEVREFPNIHFAFDRYDLNDEAKQILTEIANYMKECPGVMLLIEGHCDERGSNEYNLALGWKRANEAKKFLVSLGVDPERITTVSYGEEKPLCYEHNEACWAKNRRDEFVFCVGKCFGR